MNNNRLDIGLIGVGRIGRVHAANLAHRVPGARLAAIADVAMPVAEALAQEFNAVAHQDYRRILDDKAIQAVAICAPTDMHAQLIVEAARAGKHIFCEKPIDYDLRKIDRALITVQQARVKFMVGFNRRFDPNFRKVRELVAAGQVGKVHLVRITSRDPAPPSIDYLRVSGGLFLDMSIHDFDMARFLTGSEIVEVYATGAALVDPAIGEIGDIDTAVVSLKFANGALGSIDNSRKAVYGHDQRVEVFGSAGMVTVGNNTADSHVLSDAQGVHSAVPVHFFLERYNEAYIAEMAEFVQCVLKDTPPPVTGLDARVPVVVGLAAQKSLRENRPVPIGPAG